MQWKKLGRIYTPSGKHAWDQAYGLYPTPVYQPGADRIRIYFSSADAQRQGRITYIEVAAENPTQVITPPVAPILDLGGPGHFDDSGVKPSSLLSIGNQLHLYYMGYQRSHHVPYMLFPGLALSTDGGKSFVRHSPAPLMGRSPRLPLSWGDPFVLSGPNGYQMWCWVGQQWDHIKNARRLRTTLGFASSPDGIEWTLESTDDLVPQGTEYGLVRPWICQVEGQYQLYYTIRYTDRPYGIGYAESSDGRTWTRRDEQLHLTHSATGWDSEMLCCPAVISVHGRTYLFYNGNNNGYTGFGVAERVG